MPNDDEVNRLIDLVFIKSEVSIGAINAAYNFPNASIAELLGTVSIVAADFIDQGAFSAAEKRNVGLGLNLGIRRS